MSETTDFRCLMAGLPRTGKTTFLAALWHVVRSDEVEYSLRLDRLEGSQEYLNKIADQWSKCEALERTSGDPIEVDIRLRDPENGRTVRLRIPDISGEIFESLWLYRACETSVADMVDEIDGWLLFVHPGKLIETAWIDDANATFEDWETAAAESNVVRPIESDEEAEPTGIEWEPCNAPTQVQMVEILQLLTDASQKLFRVALIISAWDLVTEKISPSQWLERRLPLLWQFLTSNSSRFNVAVMGVSAQGGSVEEADSQAGGLLEHNIASNRIRVCTHVDKGHDISHPIRWLMSDRIGGG